eukprot:Partr_v1_DN24795_c0_g2_i2_m37370 putative Quinone oxidoreductase
MTSTLMKAVVVSRIGGPEVLSLATGLAKPVPTQDQLLVKVAYSGVNFIDTYHRSGLYAMPLPFTPGREGAGVVVQQSQNPSSNFKTGDRVAFFMPGSCAEYACPSIYKCIKVPEGVPMDVAGSCLLAGLTALMLTQETYRVKRGDTVLIHAVAGGVGQLLCQMCKQVGASVIGTTSSVEKADIGRALGADHIIDYTKVDVLTEVMRLTGDVGVDVVYDGVGKATFDASLACVRPHGWFLSFGNASGKPEPFDILRLGKGSKKLMRPALVDFISTAADFQRLAADLFERIAGGKLKISIYKQYPPENVADAHRDLEGLSHSTA